MMEKLGKNNTKVIDKARRNYVESGEFRELVDSMVYLYAEYEQISVDLAHRLARWAINHANYKLQ